MKSFFNQTSIYSFTFLIVATIIGFGTYKIFPFYLELINHDMTTPLPNMTQFYHSNYNLFSVAYIIVFFALIFTGASKGKIRDISQHILLLTIISQLFYLSFLAVSLILPLIDISDKM